MQSEAIGGWLKKHPIVVVLLIVGVIVLLLVVLLQGRPVKIGPLEIGPLDSGPTTHPATPPVPSGSTLNMDDPKVASATLVAPLSVSLPVRIEWQGGHNMVIQVYDHQASGAMVFPVGDPHRESSSGVVIPTLSPGKYEVKEWVPGANSPKTSSWIEVH